MDNGLVCLFQLFSQFADDLFFQPGDVGLRNADRLGDFLLGAFFFAAESEPHLHDLLFPFAQFGDGGKEHLPFRLVLDVPAYDVLVCPQDVGEQQLVAVPVGRKRLVDGDLATELGIFP